MNPSNRRIAWTFAIACSFPVTALRAGEHNHEHDAHLHHHVPTADIRGVAVTSASYLLPAVKQTRADGTVVDLREEIDDGRPVILNFVFTSCTAICPVTSQIFSEVQQALGPHSKVHLVSISIDPEEDTAPKIAKYASRYRAGASWDFYTGSLAASIATQKAFMAFQGDKMNHTPVTFIRPRPDARWKRVDGLATSSELVALYHGAIAMR